MPPRATVSYSSVIPYSALSIPARAHRGSGLQRQTNKAKLNEALSLSTHVHSNVKTKTPGALARSLTELAFPVGTTYVAGQSVRILFTNPHAHGTGNDWTPNRKRNVYRVRCTSLCLIALDVFPLAGLQKGAQAVMYPAIEMIKKIIWIGNCFLADSMDSGPMFGESAPMMFTSMNAR